MSQDINIHTRILSKQKGLFCKIAALVACLVLLPAGAVKMVAGDWCQDEDMVYIAGGEFMMGSDVVEAEQPPHRVFLDDFFMDRYEVSNREFCRFLNDSGRHCESIGSWIELGTDCLIVCNNGNYSPKPGFEEHPVIEVSWFGAAAYAEWAGKSLPTEAQWEYAAKGGRLSKGYMYSGGDDPNMVSWYEENSDGETHASGTREPNELGLYDMSGNVYEWCADWYDKDYYKHGVYMNPRGPLSGKYKVLRGGSWVSGEYIIRCTYRHEDLPVSVGEYNYGFRCIRPADAVN